MTVERTRHWPRPTRWGGRYATVLLIPLILAGCGLFSADPPPCPAITILEQARAVTLYRDGPGRDLSDVTFEVELANVVSRCDYDIDRDGSGVVDMEFILLLQATRGPAAETDSVEVPYFVAISDPKRRIVAKEVFRVTLPFGETDVRTQVSDEIEQRIPLRAGAPGPAYETFLGLQLTRSQLDDARRLKAR